MLIKKLQGQLEKSKGIYYEYDAESTPLGEGGMGVVYRGFRVDQNTGLRTEVAIKALHADLPEEVYARAEREASIQLRHDNLVEMLGLISVFESNRWGESIYHHYVVSEFLHGIELSDLLAGRLDKIKDGDDRFARELYNNYIKDKEGTSIYIIKNILSGVLALHDKGYIHRDIDPSNIMVTSDGHIKLIDFGIANNLKALGSNDKLMTAAGKFIGKAEYASPELVLGDVRSQNYTTDIYSLGILLYQLCTGHLPFNGTDQEILAANLHKQLSLSDIKGYDFKRIIRKAIEKSQSKRYATVA
jgi:serine/threonine protein kinase